MIDVAWVSFAFLLGLAATRVGLPPLAGYLLAGFALHALDVRTGDTLAQFSELGITLLLFTIGLKLKIPTLLRPQVWAVAILHLLLITALLAALFLLAGAAAAPLGLELLTGLDGKQAMIVAFALSFSSTVFAVKFLEERGDLASVYGRTMIGILIMQDIAAVLFLAAYAGKVPSPWALLLLPALWPLKHLLSWFLSRVGHGELLVLFGLSVAVGGAELFDLFKVKGDLGALALGVLLSRHRAADELAHALLSLKDLFLVGFFLSVGLSVIPGPAEIAIAAGLLLVIPLKSALFFWLLVRFRMRSRTSLFAAFGLANYSEFGLIVMAITVGSGLLPPEWLSIIAVALALSFVAASPLNREALALYERFRLRLRTLQHPKPLPEEAEIDPGRAAALVFGMGRVGTGAYDKLFALGLDPVVGLDHGLDVVARHLRAQRHVIRASGTDLDFWTRLKLDLNDLSIVILAMPSVRENVFAAEQLRRIGYQGAISAATRYEDHVALLREAGVSHVTNLYREAGAGLAEDAVGAAGAEPTSAA